MYIMAGTKKQHSEKKKVCGREEIVGKLYQYFGEYQEKYFKLSHNYINRT